MSTRDETVLAQITVRPLMWWLWWGGLIMTIGGLWCLLAGARGLSVPRACARAARASVSLL